MKSKRKKIYCFILMIFLTASCICCDDFTADSMMYLSGATNESIQIIQTDDDISNNDVCTVEMLGNVHTSFLCCQSTRKTGGTQRKSEILFWGLINPAYLQITINSFTPLNADNFKTNTDAAEIIQFIHNKDGKKEL